MENSRIRVLFISALLILSIFPSFVTADASNYTASFADMDAVGHRMLEVRAANGTLLGVYNTTASGVPLPAGDVIFILKPNAMSQVNDPVLWISNTLTWVQQDNRYIGLIILSIVVGALIAGRR